MRCLRHQFTLAATGDMVTRAAIQRRAFRVRASTVSEATMGMTEDMLDLVLETTFDREKAPSVISMLGSMAPVVDRVAKTIRKFARMIDVASDKVPELSSSGGKVLVSYGASWLYDVSPVQYSSLRRSVVEELRRSGYNLHVVL